MICVAKERDTKWFAAKLRELRQRVGYTQTELADAAGVKPLTIVRYEKADSEPTYTVLQALAKALGVSLSEFEEPTGEGDSAKG